MSIVSEGREKLKAPDSSLLPAILVMATLYFGREVFVPLALAALLSFLLVPVSALFERWGMRRTPAGLLVVFLSLVAVTALGWTMLGQIYNLAVELPQYKENINQKIESLHLHSAGRLSNTLAMLTEETKQLRGDAPPATTVLPDAPKPHIRVKWGTRRHLFVPRNHTLAPLGAVSRWIASGWSFSEVDADSPEVVPPGKYRSHIRVLRVLCSGVLRARYAPLKPLHVAGRGTD